MFRSSGPNTRQSPRQRSKATGRASPRRSSSRHTARATRCTPVGDVQRDVWLTSTRSGACMEGAMEHRPSWVPARMELLPTHRFLLCQPPWKAFRGTKASRHRSRARCPRSREGILRRTRAFSCRGVGPTMRVPSASGANGSQGARSRRVHSPSPPGTTSRPRSAERYSASMARWMRRISAGVTGAGPPSRTAARKFAMRRSIR